MMPTHSNELAPALATPPYQLAVCQKMW